MKVFRGLLSLFLLGTVLSLQAQEESVALRLNLDDDFNVDMKNSIVMKMEIMGQVMEMNIQYLGQASAIDAEGSDHVGVSYSIEDVVFEMDAGEEKGRYDSRTNENTFPHEATELISMAEMLHGIKIDMEYNSKGEVVQILNSEELLDHLMEAAGEEVSEEDTEIFRQQMAIQTEQGLLADQVGIISMAFPEETISIGDTWTATQNTAGYVPIQMSLDYTVSDIQDGKVYLDISGTLDPEESPIAAMFADFGFVGNMVIDQETGWVLKQEVSMDANYTGEESEGEKEEENELAMKLFIHITSTSEM